MSTLSDGWKCPGCGACYAPFVQKCDSCGPATAVTIVGGCNHDLTVESTAGRVCAKCGALLQAATITWSPLWDTCNPIIESN